MSDNVNGEIFNAHVEAMWLLADDAWLQLDPDERALLEAWHVDRETWDREFGHRLFSYDLVGPNAPRSIDEAHDRRGNFPEDDLRRLASAHVRRVRVPGGPGWSEDFSESHAFFEAPPITAGMGRGPNTPFDQLINRLSLTGDRVQIGPFRLYGALEWLAICVSAMLLWIPVTLANSWRVLVLHELDAWVLAKVIGGWLLVGGVIVALVALPESA